MASLEQLRLNIASSGDSWLGEVFETAIRDLVKRDTLPEIEATFYPYAGLSSTIRLRKGRVYARVSDVLRNSPAEVVHALACILVAKLYRLEVPRIHERVYREYTISPAIRAASDEVRRIRGYKITSSPQGKHYDLEEIYEGLNDLYFDGTLGRPELSWSQRRTKRVLGHHDHIHGAIVISRSLDSASAPRFVLDYVMYHEMLHIKHKPHIVGGRTIYHSREFRDDEREFEHYREAIKWLDRVSARADSRLRRKGRVRARKRTRES